MKRGFSVKGVSVKGMGRWGGGLSTDMAATEAGSTHPTGIHSCLSSLSCLNISFDVQMRK